MVRDLVPHNDRMLRTRCEQFDFKNPPFDPIACAKDLAETMLAHKGLGLAAPQIGVPYRIIAIASDPITVMFNPIIVDRSKVSTNLDEGCLSFPGLTLKVSRPRLIKVRYTLPNNEVVTKQFSDMTARIICHEVDHIDGITFIEAQPGLKRDFARKKWAKLVKQGVQRIPPTVVDTAELLDNVQRSMKGTTR